MTIVSSDCDFFAAVRNAKALASEYGLHLRVRLVASREKVVGFYARQFDNVCYLEDLGTIYCQGRGAAGRVKAAK